MPLHTGATGEALVRNKQQGENMGKNLYGGFDGENRQSIISRFAVGSFE